MIESKVSSEYDGSTRKLFKCTCKQCNNDFWRPKHVLDKSICCSKECYKVYREKTGKRVFVSCSHCDNEFKRFQHHLAKVESKRYFCSRECQRQGSIKHRGNCINCQSELIGKSKQYCSHNCQQEFQYTKRIELWKTGNLVGIDNGESICSWLRRYIFEKFNNKCCLCGWCEINKTTGKVPLQVDHIDGNYKNNTEENLRLLCPNCHSLTPTYGGLNKGKGREKRRKKLQGIQIMA